MDNNIVQHYRGTTEAWATASYIPADGEIVVEVITQPDSSVIRKIKVGDGLSTYSQLSYVDADTAAQLEAVVNRISDLENNAARCATDTELKTEIEALQGTILTVLSNTKGEIENAYTTAITEAVNTAKTELNGRAEGLDTRLTEAEKQIRGLQGDTAVAGLSSRVDTLENTTIDSKVQDAVDGLKEEIKGTTDGLASNIEGIQANLDEKADRSYVDDKVASLATGIDVQAELDTLRELLANNNSTAAAALGKVLDTVEASLKTDVDTATAVLGYITNIYRELADLGRDNDFIINQLYAVSNSTKDAIEDAKTDLEDGLCEIDTAVTLAYEKLGTLDGTITSATKQVNDAVALINGEGGAIADLADYKEQLSKDIAAELAKVTSENNNFKANVNASIAQLMAVDQFDPVANVLNDLCVPDNRFNEGNTFNTPGDHVRAVYGEVAELQEGLQQQIERYSVNGLLYSDNKLSLARDGEAVGEAIEIVSGTGGGGGGVGNQTIVTLEHYSEPDKAIYVTKNDLDTDVAIGIKFYSTYSKDHPIHPGEVASATGTAIVYVNDKLIEGSQQTVNNALLVPEEEQVQYVLVPSDALVNGSNKIRIKVTDTYNGYNTIGTYTIELVDIDIELHTTQQLLYYDARKTTQVILGVNPIGNMSKQLHIVVDEDTEHELIVDASGTSPRYPNLTEYVATHGVHTVEVWVSAEYNDGVETKTLSSEHKSVVIVYSDDRDQDGDGWTQPLLAVKFPYEGQTVHQYDTLTIPYLVYHPKATEADIKVSVYPCLMPGQRLDDAYFTTELKGVETVSALNDTAKSFALNTFPATKGSATCCEVVFEYSYYNAYNVLEQAVENFYFYAVALDEDQNAVSSNQILYLSADSRQNSEANKETWTYSMPSGELVECELTGFNWESNGWITPSAEDLKPTWTATNPPIEQPPKEQEPGSRLRVTGDARVKINKFNPYKFTNAGNTNGLTIEVDFAIRDISDRTAEVLRCGYYHTGTGAWCGLTLLPDRAKFYTEDGSITDTKYGEDSRVRLSIVVEPKATNSFVSMYLDGIITKMKLFDEDSLYYDGTDCVFEIGSSDCSIDIFAIRMYSQALIEDEIVRNYIADRPTAEVKNRLIAKNSRLYLDEHGNKTAVPGTANRYYLCYDTIAKNSEIPVITFILQNGMVLPKDKNTVFENSVKIRYIDRNLNTDEPVLNDVALPYFAVQGTSSATYDVKNWKIKLPENVAGIPVIGENPAKTLCIKVDYAESSGTHNTGIANYAETVYTKLDNFTDIPARQKQTNGKGEQDIRSTICGQPCLVFMQHGEDATPVFYAKGNINYDKGAKEIFGFTDENADDYGVQCWEFKENTDGYCNFFTPLPEFENISTMTADDLDEANWTSSFEPRFIKDQTDPTLGEFHWDDYEIDGVPADGIETSVKAISSLGRSARQKLARELSYCIAKFKEMQRFVASTAICTYLAGKQKGDPNILRFMPNPDPSPANAAELKRLCDEGKIEALLEPETLIYQGEKKTYSYDTAEYRLAKFTTYFNDFFDLDWCLIYYIFTYVTLMADQRTKNMFLTYWADEPGSEDGKWYPYLYDNDTTFGLNNQGDLVYEYFDTDDSFKDGKTLTELLEEAGCNTEFHEGIELTVKDPIYSGQFNVLWFNFKKIFETEITKAYRNLRGKGVFDPDTLSKKFIDEHSDKWSATIYNEDAYNKYIVQARAGDRSNLTRLSGSRTQHLKYFLDNRISFCDSKWNAGDNSAHSIQLRLNAGSRADGIKITAFSDTTMRVNFGTVNETAETTAYMKAGTYHDFARPTVDADGEAEFANNNFDVIFTPAHEISEIDGLAPLRPGKLAFPNAPRLTRLIIGSADAGYYNDSLYSLELSRCPLLQTLDLQNCRGLGNAKNQMGAADGFYKEGATSDPVLRLTGCPLIKDVYATGTQITSVTLPVGGQLGNLRLPHTITSIDIKGHGISYSKTKNGSMNQTDWGEERGLFIAGDDSGNDAKITSITIKDCPNINSFDLYERFKLHITELDLNDINWTFANFKEFEELVIMAEKDPSSVSLTGTIKINTLTGAQSRRIENAFNNESLEIRFGTLENTVYFMPSHQATEAGFTVDLISHDSNAITIDNTHECWADLVAYETTIDVPSQTNRFTYSFAGWTESKGDSTYYGESAIRAALSNIAEDRYLYPVFEETPREYTVHFALTETKAAKGELICDDSGNPFEFKGTYGDEIQIPAELTPAYVLELLYGDDSDKYEFRTWSHFTVEGDCVCYALCEEITEWLTLVSSTGGLYSIDGANKTAVLNGFTTTIAGNDTWFAVPTAVTALGELPAPDAEDTYTVVEIDNLNPAYGMFQARPFITKLKLPYTLTAISDRGFCLDATNLREVVFNDGGSSAVTEIPEECFKGCVSLEGVDWPPELVTVGREAFYNTALEAVELPSKVVTLDFGAFMNCLKLKTIQLPSTTKTIGDNCFYNCGKSVAGPLTLVLPNKIQEIGGAALGASGIIFDFFDVDDGDPVKFSLKDGFLLEDLGTDRVKLRYTTAEADPSAILCEQPALNVTELAEYAFRDITGIEHIIVPGTVAYIPAHCFYNIGAKSITFSEGVVSIDTLAIFNGTQLSAVSLPSSLLHISSRAFMNTNLSSITLSETNGAYKVIDNVLFYKDGSHLLIYPPAREGSSYTVPETVKHIPAGVFAQVKNLEEIIFEAVPAEYKERSSDGDYFYEEGIDVQAFTGATKPIKFIVPWTAAEHPKYCRTRLGLDQDMVWGAPLHSEIYFADGGKYTYD